MVSIVLLDNTLDKFAEQQGIGDVPSFIVYGVLAVFFALFALWASKGYPRARRGEKSPLVAVGRVLPKKRQSFTAAQWMIVVLIGVATSVGQLNLGQWNLVLNWVGAVITVVLVLLIVVALAYRLGCVVLRRWQAAWANPYGARGLFAEVARPIRNFMWRNVKGRESREQ